MDEQVEIIVNLPLKMNFMGEIVNVTVRKMYDFKYFKENVKETIEYLGSEIIKVLEKNK